jgi:hypothetical protein
MHRNGIRSLAGYASGSSLPSPAKNFTPQLRRLLCKWQGCEVAGENDTDFELFFCGARKTEA